MSKSTPSLLALLGLVAVAGYQNREKISEMLSDARQQPPGSRPDAGQARETRGDEPQAGGGFLSEIGALFGAGSAGGTLSAGLSDLVDRFRDTGRAAPAESWVSRNANMPIEEPELAAALGEDTLDELARKTGLSRTEVLHRLSVALPDTVNRFTPEGHLPTEAEAGRFG